MPPATSPPRLILASASPRRHELLASIGVPFEVVPSDVDEDLDEVTGSPTCWAIAIARRKALHVARLPAMADAVVLAADTIVVASDGGREQILGKPIDRGDARRMLRLLSGRAHVVYTAIAISQPASADSGPVSDVVATQVRFRPLGEADIDTYLATGEPFDKAGAYGIQGHAAAFVEHIRGDYYNVVGLPVARTRELLRALYPRMAPAPDPPSVWFPILVP